MDYIAYLHKDGRSDFGVSFPDFPSCITAGRTLEEARLMAAEALSFHIRGMVEDRDAIPEPSSLDKLAKDADRKGAVAFLVSVETPEKTVRINITARESQIEEIDRLASQAGLTRSAFLVRSALGGAKSDAKRRVSAS
jgi:predicted RNase H-like HicB family nuclease